MMHLPIVAFALFLQTHYIRNTAVVQKVSCLSLILFHRETGTLFGPVFRRMTHISVCLYTHTRTHACMHTHTHTRAHTHIHTHTHTQRHNRCTESIHSLPEYRNWQSCKLKSWALFFRQYSYCLQNLDITYIAYNFSPLHEMPNIFRHFMKCLTSRIACNIYTQAHFACTRFGY